jgi:hypothetical protein
MTSTQLQSCSLTIYAFNIFTIYDVIVNIMRTVHHTAHEHIKRVSLYAVYFWLENGQHVIKNGDSHYGLMQPKKQN